MPYEVRYQDATGYTWSAFFETEEEAMSQAVEEALNYGGTTPQEVVDDQGTQVVDQVTIEAAAEEAR